MKEKLQMVAKSNSGLLAKLTPVPRREMTKGMKAYNQGINLRRTTYQRMAMLSKII